MTLESLVEHPEELCNGKNYWKKEFFSTYVADFHLFQKVVADALRDHASPMFFEENITTGVDDE